MKCVRCKIEIDKTGTKNTHILASTICTACENFYDNTQKIICKTCGENKSITEYYGAINTKTGYETSCKACKKLSDSAKYQKKKQAKEKKKTVKKEFNPLEVCGIKCSVCQECDISNYIFPDNTQSSLCKIKRRPIQFIKSMVK